jgi:hypothetical protein
MMMTTAQTTADGDAILAIDFGKYKSLVWQPSLRQTPLTCLAPPRADAVTRTAPAPAEAWIVKHNGQ